MAGGRKLEFERGEALDAAMKVFWTKGYVGSSLADLTESMGINKPSMYSSFGNKEDLFVEAIELYVETVAHSKEAHLKQINVPLRDRLKDFLMAVVEGQCDPDLPKGCFVTFCNKEAASGQLPEKAKKSTIEAASYMPDLFKSFFETDPEAIQRGLKQEARANALALATTLSGTATMARAGSKLTDLEHSVEVTLKGLGL